VKPVAQAATACPLLAPVARRIHIVGVPGIGKTTLALQLGQALDAPVFHLDNIGFVNGNWQQRRPQQRRLAEMRRIAEQPSWISEGVYLWWTDEVLRAADVIIWLDHLSWRRVAWRVAKRSAGHLWQRILNARGLHELWWGLRYTAADVFHTSWWVRDYYREHHSHSVPTHEDWATHETTAACLEPYAAKLYHCRSEAHLEMLLALLEPEKAGNELPAPELVIWRRS
jgi:adenylate kinase family enzyme